MRKDLLLVMIFRHSTTPGTFCRNEDQRDRVTVETKEDMPLWCTHLMLQAAVLSLCVFPDNQDIHVTVACSDARQRLAVDHVCIQIQSGPAVTGSTCEKRFLRRKLGLMKPHRSRLFLDL